MEHNNGRKDTESIRDGETAIILEGECRRIGVSLWINRRDVVRNSAVVATLVLAQEI